MAYLESAKLTVSEASYNNYTLRELTHNGMGIDTNPYGIIDMIHRNPVIGELPQIAETYGLYSSFVITDNDIYFVFGNSSKIVHSNNFLEFGNELYHESYLRKCGCHSRAGFLFYDWNAVPVTRGMEYVYGIHAKLSVYEYLCDRYKCYGLKAPDAFLIDDDMALSVLDDCKKMTDNETIPAAEKAKWHVLAKKTLYDIAAWNWPIRPDNASKCGFGAFMSSGYHVPLSSQDENMKIYQNTEKWNNIFLGELGASSEIVLRKDEMDYVKDNLNRLHIPYIDNGKLVAAMRNSVKKDHMIVSMMCNDSVIQSSDGFPDTESINVMPRDKGTVDYIRYLFVLAHFEPKCNEFGSALTSLSYKERSERFDEDIIKQRPGAYVFFIPHEHLNGFIEFAEKNCIRIGHPKAPKYNSVGFYTGVYLAVELYNMPLIEDYLHSLYSDSFSVHSVSLHHNAPYEKRYREKPMKDRNGAFHSGGIISESKPFRNPDEITSAEAAGGTVNLPKSFFDDGQNTLSTAEYEKAGFYVDNDDRFKNDVLRRYIDS